MEALSGPFVIAALLLATAGVAKIVTPEPTRAALASVGVRVPAAAVVALGVAEVAVGAWSVAWGGRLAAAVLCVAYLSFAGFVVLARRADTASCGCFGSASTPPSGVHLAVNLALAAIAGLALAAGVPPVADVLADQPLGGAAYVGFVIGGTYLTYVLLTLLPRVLAAPEPAPRPFSVHRS